MDTRQDGQLPLRERNRLRTRADILDAAAEILSGSGYAGTTLEELSRQAGIARGTLYAHFPGGREEIVREVYLRIAETVYVRGIGLREATQDTAGRIAALARALVEATSTPAGRFYGVMGADIVPVLSGVMGGTSRSFEDLIRLDLSAARAAGRLREDADVDALAAAFSGAIRASGARAATGPGTAEQQVAAVKLLAQGLLSPASVQPSAARSPGPPASAGADPIRKDTA
ncbi:TetR/AcrR family transcriptional regulator [Arthrobacter deserti]|uniref:TetR/AcrR family transcriptional regulator n=1 Tax=Arthrobacter deserti TaxID=1742687 RepID=A0ABX1JLS6_9MICC|nr:TetR/AcrR family transcriptional regulator [Arthrobacter deserti]